MLGRRDLGQVIVTCLGFIDEKYVFVSGISQSRKRRYFPFRFLTYLSIWKVSSLYLYKAVTVALLLNTCQISQRCQKTVELGVAPASLEKRARSFCY